MRVAFLLLLLQATFGSESSAPVTYTSQGYVQGTRSSNFGVQEFLGIPYAAPPVGHLRWRPPQAPAVWPGIRSATSFGPNCPQNGLAGVSPLPNQNEDCLYLNIWTPASACENSDLPVLVFLHGGGFVAGSGAQPITDGSALAATTNSIVVTINYRLGLLGMVGFAATLEESRTFGNYNFMDQIQALRWVQQNIRYFGGDPSAVTLGGQSAGGISVSVHLVASQSRGLFQQAIIESAVVTNLTTQALITTQGNALIADLGCPTSSSAATLACLRAVNVSTLLHLQPTILTGTIRPSIDGVILTDQPLSLIKQGNFARVPVLAGNVQNESTVFLADAPLAYYKAGLYPINQTFFDEVTSNPALPAGFGPHFSTVVNALYPATAYPSVYGRLAAIEGDRDYTCQLRHYVDLLSGAGGNHLYVYQLRHPYPYTDPQTFLGTFHTTDLSYVFGTSCMSDFWPYGTPTCTTGTAPQFWAPGTVDYQLSQQVMAVWGSFLWNGNPGVAWPQYNTATRAIQIFSTNPFLHVEDNLASAQCAYWDGLVPY